MGLRNENLREKRGKEDIGLQLNQKNNNETSLFKELNITYWQKVQKNNSTASKRTQRRPPKRWKHMGIVESEIYMSFETIKKEFNASIRKKIGTNSFSIQGS